MSGIARLVGQSKREKHWLAARLEKCGKEQEVESWVDPSIEIHPSSLRTGCMLAFQWGFLGHKGPIPEGNRDRMDNGIDAHKRWYRKLDRAGVLVDAEVPIEGNDPDVMGSMDFILIHNTLAELKTTNERYFSSLTVSSDPYANMRLIYNWNPGYAYQLEIYDEYGGPFNQHVFIIENTNDQRYKIIPVAPRQYREEALSLAIPAQLHLKQGSILPRPFLREEKICRYCNHKDLCDRYEDGDEETLQIVKERLEMLCPGQ